MGQSGWMNGTSFPTRTVGADRIRPKPAKPSRSLNGSSFPTQTVGADRIRPPFSQRGNGKTHTHGTSLSVEWGGEFCALYQYNLPYHCGGRAADGRILSAPTRCMRSTGYLRKSGVTGGFYPPLQLRRQSRRRVDMLVAPYKWREQTVFRAGEGTNVSVQSLSCL